jgi:hypothetical protein
MTPTSCVVSQLFSYAAIIFRIFLTAEPLCPQNSDRSFSAIGSTQELPKKNKPPAPWEIWTRLRDGLIVGTIGCKLETHSCRQVFPVASRIQVDMSENRVFSAIYRSIHHRF